MTTPMSIGNGQATVTQRLPTCNPRSCTSPHPHHARRPGHQERRCAGGRPLVLPRRAAPPLWPWRGALKRAGVDIAHEPDIEPAAAASGRFERPAKAPLLSITGAAAGAPQRPERLSRSAEVLAAARIGGGRASSVLQGELVSGSALPPLYPQGGRSSLCHRWRRAPHRGVWHSPRCGQAGGRCIMSRSGVFYAFKAMERVAAGTTGADAPRVPAGRAVAHDARAAARPDAAPRPILQRGLDAMHHRLGRAGA
jgi:hypothetical protein